MILFDTSVSLDIATADPVWLPWSEKEFRTATAQGLIAINPIILERTRRSKGAARYRTHFPTVALITP